MPEARATLSVCLTCYWGFHADDARSIQALPDINLWTRERRVGAFLTAMGAPLRANDRYDI
jgi:hypothetical protein